MKQDYQACCLALKEYLDLFTLDYIIDHLEPEYTRNITIRRDEDKLYRRFAIGFNEEAILAAIAHNFSIPKNRQRYHYIYKDYNIDANSLKTDWYLNHILSEFEIDYSYQWDQHSDIFTEDDKIKDLYFMSENFAKGKEMIPSLYNRDMHIRFLILKCTSYLQETLQDRNKIDEIINDTLSPTSFLHFSEIEIEGMLFDLLEVQNKHWNLRLKSSEGIFGKIRHYGSNHSFLKTDKDNNQIIEIPESLESPYIWNRAYITEISKNVFNNLPEVKLIRIPKTVRKIDWSFWGCAGLMAIDVDIYNIWYKSIWGILFSYDMKRVIAFPCKLGNKFTVPDGVEVIEKFAFKNCTELTTVVLPSSIKRIGINAFYRCTKLKEIICDFSEKDCINEGLTGDHRMEHLKWTFLK